MVGWGGGGQGKICIRKDPIKKIIFFVKSRDRRIRTVDIYAFYLNPVQNGSSLQF